MWSFRCGLWLANKRQPRDCQDGTDSSGMREKSVEHEQAHFARLTQSQDFDHLFWTRLERASKYVTNISIIFIKQFHKLCSLELYIYIYQVRNPALLLRDNRGGSASELPQNKCYPWEQRLNCRCCLDKKPVLSYVHMLPLSWFLSDLLYWS